MSTYAVSTDKHTVFVSAQTEELAVLIGTVVLVLRHPGVLSDFKPLIQAAKADYDAVSLHQSLKGKIVTAADIAGLIDILRNTDPTKVEKLAFGQHNALDAAFTSKKP